MDTLTLTHLDLNATEDGSIPASPGGAVVLGQNDASDLGLATAATGSDAFGSEVAFFASGVPHLEATTTATAPGSVADGESASNVGSASTIGQDAAVNIIVELPASHQPAAAVPNESAAVPNELAPMTYGGPATAAMPYANNDTFDSVSVPGSGLVFHNDFTGSAVGDTEFQNDVITAEETLARFWTNTDNVDLTFNDPNQGNNGDAADNTFFGNNQTYATVKSALDSHEFGSFDEDSSVLPSTDPSGGGNWFIPLGYERMLGIGGGSAAYSDDSVSLNTFYLAVSSTNDVSITDAMMHEISEGTMGRIGGLGGGTTGAGTGWSTMDLFRFNASGVPDYTDGKDGKTTYFSYDGGTELSSAAGLSWHNQFSSGGTVNHGGDTADWDQQDVFGSTGGGETFGLSLTDIEVMQVLGWDPYYTVAPSQTSTGITAETDGGVFVQSGGKALFTDANGGFVDVDNGGVTSYTYIAGSGYDGITGDETVFAGGVSDYAFLAGGTQALLGGEAISATIADFGNQLVFGNGVAFNTFDYWNEIVYTGGTAEFTSAFTGVGDTYLSGGTADFTTLSGGAAQLIYSGGLGYEAFVYSGSFDTLYSGATTSFTQVYAGGAEHVYQGGVAWYTDITSGGAQYISGISFAAGQYGETVSGSIAIGGNEYVENGGFDYGTYDNWNQFVYTGGETEFVSANTGDGDQYVSGGVTYYTAVSNEAAQIVYSGGSANSTVVSSGGIQEVESSGYSDGTVILSGGTGYTFSGGVDSATTIDGGGTQYVYGTSYYGTIEIFGNQYVEAGGDAYGTNDIWNQYVYTSGQTWYVSAPNGDGDQYVSGGSTYFSYLSGGGGEYVFTGGLGYGTTVVDGGFQYVEAGGTADYTVVSSGSFQEVLSTGNASGTTVLAGGTEYTEPGGVDSATTISNGGAQYVYGNSDFGTIEVGGNQYVEAGGDAYGTNDIWNQYVYTSGQTWYVSAPNGDGDQYVSGGTTFFSYMSGGGGEILYSGGVGSGTTVIAGGFQTVEPGGTAVATVVSSGGSLSILSGGRASGSQIDAHGTEIVYGGGATVKPVIAGAGAVLELISGAVASGAITFVGTGGELQVYGTTVPSNTISGMVPGDTIDLPNVAYSSAGTVAREPGNALQLSEGGGTYTLTLDSSQKFTGDFFQLSKDASGGTLITEITGQPSTADFIGDGMSDILWQYDDTTNSGDPSNGNTAIWLMNGTTETSASVIGTLGLTWRPIATGDFNGDGEADIIWQYENGANPADTGNGNTAVWLMNGTTETSAAIVATPGASWHVITTGDFNGDGKADILWQYENSSNPADTSNGETAVWLMNGFSETSGAVIATTLGASWHAIATGDFDGDGKSDIIWQYENSANPADTNNGETAIWLMNGTTETSGAIIGNFGSVWHVVGTGDFNGDGKSDILWQYENSANPSDSLNGEAVIWLMNGTTETSSAIVGNPGASWHAIATGDFTGNGKSDILWQYENSANPSDASNGETAIWLMNGTTPTATQLVGTPPASWHVVT